MRKTTRIFAALATSVLILGSASAADGPYLFDLIKKPSYRQGWNGMMANAAPPQWLTAFSKGGNGVSTPSSGLEVEGIRYELGYVCKPHDCGDNQLQVLFGAGGGKAWGLLREAGKPPKFLGNPSPAQKSALTKALDN